MAPVHSAQAQVPTEGAVHTLVEFTGNASKLVHVREGFEALAAPDARLVNAPGAAVAGEAEGREEEEDQEGGGR